MVDYQDLLKRLTELKDGCSSSTVEIGADLLATTVDGIKELKEELQNAKDMLMMKPSMAKRLNERIRLLEEQLEQLRAKNKVKEMEKRITTLQSELKASYATKNFTLKNNLLELEKKYQEALQENPQLREMWNDVSQILGDDAKEVMPSYMSRSATFLRVGTMARPGAPLTHGTGHTTEAVPEAEAAEAEADTMSAVQAAKKQLEGRIEQASKDAVAAGSTNVSAIPGPMATERLAEASQKRLPSSGSDSTPKRSAEEEVVSPPEPIVDAGEQLKLASPIKTESPATTPEPPSTEEPAAKPDAEDEPSTTGLADTVQESLSTLRNMYLGLARDFAASSQGPADAKATISSATFGKQVKAAHACVEHLRQTLKSAACKSADVSSIESEAEELLACIDELRSLYDGGEAPAAPADQAWTSALDKKMDVVVEKVEELKALLAERLKALLTVPAEEVPSAKDGVLPHVPEDKQAVPADTPQPPADIPVACADTASSPINIPAIPEVIPAVTEAIPTDSALPPEEIEHKSSLPSLADLRQASMPDLDYWADAPSVAQADVNTIVSLFAAFAQELAEQHLLPEEPVEASGPLTKPVTDTTAEASPFVTEQKERRGEGLPSAQELVQYFRLYMTTHGAAVFRALLRKQDVSKDGTRAESPTPERLPTAGPDAIKTQPVAEAIGGSGGKEVDEQEDTAPAPGTPSAVLGSVISPSHDTSAQDQPDHPTQLPQVPPISPAAATSVAPEMADGPTASADAATSSMGKKTFSAVARAVCMLNTKYKALLPDTPQTDALFADLANMLENVIATHELKSHASKQIIARSLKHRGSAPTSVTSHGNWDSVGTAGTPGGYPPESPFRGSLRGPGSDGQLTPRSRTPRQSKLENASTGADEGAARTPTQEAEPAPGAEEEVEAAEQHEELAAAQRREDEDGERVQSGGKADRDEREEVGGGDAATRKGSVGLESLSPRVVDRKVKELQNENEYLTRILIDAKVELADTKGEYMALLRALRKALSRENNARAKLDELERVVSVMAPGGPGAAALQYGDEMSLRPIRVHHEDGHDHDGNTESGPSSRTASQYGMGEIQPML